MLLILERSFYFPGKTVRILQGEVSIREGASIDARTVVNSVQESTYKVVCVQPNIQKHFLRAQSFGMAT